MQTKKMEFEELKEAIEKIRVVDAHAHNIVALDSSFPFINAFAEATGDALVFAPHSLSFKRNLRETAELYGCANSLQAVEEYRRSAGLESISSACFKAAGVCALLIDDGLSFDKMQELHWHKSFVPFVGRLLRIEHLAEQILEHEAADGSPWTLDKFIEKFLGSLTSAADKIVGLKSIVAYRSGLEINTHVSKIDAEEGFAEVLQGRRPLRIANKSFIDYIFIRSLEIAIHFDLPVQIHTGFGDKDLDLRLSNPLCLRMLLDDERFSKCRLVLLHASYPYSREASYLASVYPQVYLDFGLAVPKLSVHGMVSSVKELLELAPLKKVMYSSDGYAFPETHYLGAKKAREIIYSVFSDACRDGDLTVPEALEAVKDILKENAINFYKLKESGEGLTLKDVTYVNSGKKENSTPGDGTLLVRIIWVDGSGQHRCRVVPAKRFYDVVKKNGVGLACAAMGMTSAVDAPAAETNLTGTGEIRLKPDISTIRRIPWMEHEEMVLGDMLIRPHEAWDCCPRDALRRVSNVLKDEFDMVMHAGFENEFVLLKNASREGKEDWVPIHSGPYCSSSKYGAVSPVFHEIIPALESLNIPVEQLHAEAGKGQFEIALGHLACTQSADNVIYTREAIRAIARKHGLLATLVPKYALDDIGSGCHVHFSLYQNGENVFMSPDGSHKHGMSAVGEQFMAGVLHHLPSILAFTAPVPNSYDRIQPNTWSGAYLCWGKENREAPIRTACPPGVVDGLVSNFEIKAFDGCANPYLGLAAILAAGIDGLRRKLQLPEPVDTNPAVLEGKIERLPKSLAESLEALRNDTIMEDIIGEKLLAAVKGIRKAEINYYAQNKDAFKQMIHRY